MSERKSAEVKFRCTPSFKSALQAMATEAGQSLTEFIESAVWAQRNARLEGTSLVGNAIEALREPEVDASAEVVSEGWNTPPSSEDGAAEDTVVMLDPDLSQFTLLMSSPSSTVVECTCRPWEFCTHKADA